MTSIKYNGFLIPIPPTQNSTVLQVGMAIPHQASALVGGFSMTVVIVPKDELRKCPTCCKGINSGEYALANPY